MPKNYSIRKTRDHAMFLSYIYIRRPLLITTYLVNACFALYSRKTNDLSESWYKARYNVHDVKGCARGQEPSKLRFISIVPNSSLESLTFSNHVWK